MGIRGDTGWCHPFLRYSTGEADVGWCSEVFLMIGYWLALRTLAVTWYVVRSLAQCQRTVVLITGARTNQIWHRKPNSNMSETIMIIIIIITASKMYRNSFYYFFFTPVRVIGLWSQLSLSRMSTGWNGLATVRSRLSHSSSFSLPLALVSWLDLQRFNNLWCLMVFCWLE